MSLNKIMIETIILSLSNSFSTEIKRSMCIQQLYLLKLCTTYDTGIRKTIVFYVFLFKIFIHELSLIFFTDCKELMRFINDLLVCFFFPLFQVFLFQTLSPSSLALPVTSSSCLSVCLSACLSVFVCLIICLSLSELSVDLSLSLYLSRSSYFSHFRYIFCSFCLCLFRSIIQYFYLTQ